MFKVEQLPLWDVLKTVDDAQRAKVRQLIEGAAAILDRVIETFPTYTLHNSTHAENVVQLMADLLGDRAKDLSPLEAALLMLSAFYHDIGMVFREEERKQLTEESEWKTFLDTEPDAYLAVKKAGEVPLDVAEWYCRWRHADRVYIYLNRLSDDLLKWSQTSIREELGELCRSHNRPTADLYELRTDFRGEADLRFCAILLRLADILDFDRTRTPEAVYEYLGLSRRIDPRQDSSDVEWRKHLCSEGFRFPKKRPDGFQLGFVAGPDEPGVEYDIREFLKVIEEEMQQCRGLLATCSERWRTLPLPVSVEPSNIHSNGYRYGEYRFTLDQNQVIDLLMGEDLYENPYVFVRELIQNAIDASRHRRFIERASGHPDFEPKPIQVRHWIDRDGYQWVRFDDYGMGMDEEIVRNHLLKVGSSYYRTAAFRAEVLRAREKVREDFVPISRFGIGLLSCFLAGDQIEISTLRRSLKARTADPIRLSLNGLHGFFTFRTPHLPADPMPAPDAKEPGYRVEPGTSIAVRFDPTRERKPFNPKSLLISYVACPPIPIEFDGERIGGDPTILVDRPWCERATITVRLSPAQQAALRKIGSFQQPLEIEFLPIDLTRHSPTPELKGQILFIVLKSDIKLKPEYTPSNLAIGSDSKDIYIGYFIREWKGIRLPVELPESIREIIRGIDFHESWLSHNGVAIPSKGPLGQYLGLSGYVSSKPHWQVGLIALSDSLRPDVSISRDELQGLPLRLYSAAGLALYNALSELGVDPKSGFRVYEVFSEFLPSQSPRLPRLGDLLADPYLQINGAWSQLPIFFTDRGLLSLHEIQDLVENGPITITNLPFQAYSGGFLGWCTATLAQVGLNVAAQFVKDKRWNREEVQILARRGNPPNFTEGHKLFPPLAFLPFIGSGRLRPEHAPVVNATHPFAGWLIERAPEIAKRYPGIFERLRWILFEAEDFFWSAALSGLNGILDRLRELHPAVRPPENLILTSDDFDGP